MRLTIHLFSAGPWEPDDLVQDSSGSGVDRWRQEPRLALNFECVAIGTFRVQDRPMWSEILDGYFDVDWQRSVSSSAVLLARVDDRWFAVTFGQGRHLLRQDRLVADFGLRVTANSVSADRLRSVESVLPDVTSRRTRQVVAVPSGLAAFTVDPEAEWVRSLGGWTDDHLTRGMTGSQALAVDLAPEQGDLKALHELLGHLLGRYHATTYRSHFEFIDLVVPLHPGDDRVVRLDAALTDLLPRAGRDVGVVAPRAQPGDDRVLQHWIGRGTRRPLDAIGVQYEAYDSTTPLDSRVTARDSDGAQVGPARTLRDCLTAEVPLPGSGRFVLVEGRWFEIDPERLAWLERTLAAIPEITGPRLDLPLWFHRDDEATYNEHAARHLGARLLDGRNFLGPDRRRDKIEVCDLMTSAAELICVKMLRDAGSLSHLFSQGSVSARLYRRDVVYRSHVDRLFVEYWPATPMPPPKIVYAIGSSRQGPLRETLPFFSRVNLCTHARAVRDAGLDVAVTRIVPTRTTIRPVPSLPEQRDPTGADQPGLFEI